MKSIRVLKFCIFVLAILYAVRPEHAAAYPSNYDAVTTDDFAVPPKLRSRVDFWKDIFTKYDKAHIIIHHREYPQIIFAVIDLQDDFERMSDVQFMNYRKSVERHEVEVVRQAIEDLAESEQASGQLQRSIAAKMQYFGPGTAKYRKILNEDLIRTQTGIRAKYAESVKRAGRYLPIIEKIFVEEHGLPVELTRIPFIESSFDYSAYSSVGAAGIWQFMPKTAKLYMTVNKIVDERRDPIESSRAAAKYLRGAYLRLNSWPLAVTSYNHGIAGVAKKVATLGTSDIFELIEQPEDKLFGFASSNFYPEFLAAVEIYESYKKYFPSLQLEPPIKAREMLMDRPVSASYMAEQLGVGIQSLEALNYALSKGVWEGRYKIPAGYSLKVPDRNDLHMSYSYETENRPVISIPRVELDRAESHSSTIYGGVTYKVRRGDTLISIAKKYGVKVADLKTLNNLSSNSLSVGKIITVKPKENSPDKKPVIKVIKNKETSAPAVKARQSYRVKSGDSLWIISIKFGVPIDELKKANKDNIIGNKLTGGQTIVIPVK
jgi:membrane-bound lytic murein transglycosylase D